VLARVSQCYSPATFSFFMLLNCDFFNSVSFKQFSYYSEHCYLLHVHLQPKVNCLVFLASGCGSQAEGRQGETSVSLCSGNRIVLGNILGFHIACLSSSWNSQVLLLNID